MKSMLQKNTEHLFFQALLTGTGEQNAPGREEKNWRKKRPPKKIKEIREIVGGNMKQMQFLTWKNRRDVRI